MLKITNNLSGKKEVFTPRNPNEVLMYVCGITPYDLAHVGHGRSCVTFDILFRLLNFLDYKVKYCRNFTDVDDKIINKSEKEFDNKFDFEKISQRYIKAYKEDTKKLNCLDPNFEPLVTKSKNDTTHNRRIVFRSLRNKEAVSELFRNISKKIGDRPGGYTRVIKLGNRLGDNASMAMIELVDYNDTYKLEKSEKKNILI